MFHSSIDKISPTKLDELSDTERQNLIKYNNALKYSESSEILLFYCIPTTLKKHNCTGKRILNILFYYFII